MLHIAMYSAYRNYHRPLFSSKEARSIPLIHEEFSSHTSLGGTAYTQPTFIQRRHYYVDEKIKGKGTVLGYGIN